MQAVAEKLLAIRVGDLVAQQLLGAFARELPGVFGELLPRVLQPVIDFVACSRQDAPPRRRLSRRRARRCSAPAVSPRTRTRRTATSGTRTSVSSHAPPENFLSGELGERFGIAGQLCAHFLHIAAQTLVRLAD